MAVRAATTAETIPSHASCGATSTGATTFTAFLGIVRGGCRHPTCTTAASCAATFPMAVCAATTATTFPHGRPARPHQHGGPRPPKPSRGLVCAATPRNPPSRRCPLRPREATSSAVAPWPCPRRQPLLPHLPRGLAHSDISCGCLRQSHPRGDDLDGRPMASSTPPAPTDSRAAMPSTAIRRGRGPPPLPHAASSAATMPSR